MNLIERSERGITCVVINRPLPWRVRLHGRSKPHLIKSSIFWVLGGRRPSLFFYFGLLGRAPPLRACFSLSLSLKLSKKSQKAQNLLVLPNAQKTSIHYPIQTSVARIAAPYAAHQKGSLTQKVNCKFARFNFQLLQPKHCPLNFLFWYTIIIHLTSLIILSISSAWKHT